ncbi:putative armadillo protein [Halotydeus destructor]|nr:putative armadillo protein [Halotydeus destructor]
MEPAAVQVLDHRCILVPFVYHRYGEFVLTILRVHCNVMSAEVDHSMMNAMKDTKEDWTYEEIKDLGIRLRYERFSETMRFIISHNKPLPVGKVFAFSAIGQATKLRFDHHDNMAVLEIDDSFPNIWQNGMHSHFELQLVTNERVEQHMTAISRAKNNATHVFRKLVYNNPKYCDVSLRSEEDDSFIASSDILSAHSEVFETMFNNDFLEGQTRQVKLHGISTILLSEMLRFCHTGECDFRDKSLALDLLAVADMYRLHRLTSAIEHHLLQTICLNEVTSLLTLAEDFELPELRRKCFSILKGHFRFGMLSNVKSLSQLTSAKLLRECILAMNSVQLARPLYYPTRSNIV